MGSGASMIRINGYSYRSLTIPVVYEESQANNLANFKTTNKQKLTITDPYMKLQQGYHTIPLIVRKIDKHQEIMVVHGVVGLKNLGNTCYFNSAIHCLSHTQPLLDYMLSRVFEKEINRNSKLGSKGQVTECFAQLLSDIWKDERSIGMSTIIQGNDAKDKSKDNQMKQKQYENWVDPLRLLLLIQKYSKRFEIGQQEDCQELLSYLLDMIHEDLNRCKKKENIKEKDYTGEPKEEWAAESWGEHLKINKSIVVDLFQGQLKSQVECKSCHYRSHKWEPFLFLNLPIKQQKQQQQQQQQQQSFLSKSLGSSQLKQDITCELTECLDQFQQDETIQWKCPKCQETRDCKKGIRIWKLPNILIIHLKRFEYGTKSTGKITQKVNFPLNQLDMSPYCFQQNDTVYNLYAVAQHHGSLQYGHYVSICKHRVDNQWYMYNDDAVLKIQDPEKVIVDSQAYVLFYQKQTETIFRQTITNPSCWPHNQSAKKQNLDTQPKEQLQLMEYEESEQKGQLDETSPHNISGNSMKIDSQNVKKKHSLNHLIREQNNKSNSIYKRQRPSEDNENNNTNKQTSITKIEEQVIQFVLWYIIYFQIEHYNFQVQFESGVLDKIMTNKWRQIRIKIRSPLIGDLKVLYFSVKQFIFKMKTNQIPRFFCVADFNKENFNNGTKHQRVQSSLAIREKSSNSFHTMIPPQKPQLKLNDESSNRTKEGFHRVKTDSNMSMPLRNGRNLSITSGVTTLLTNKSFQLPQKNDNPQSVNAYKKEIVQYTYFYFTILLFHQPQSIPKIHRNHLYMRQKSCRSNYKLNALQFQTEITEKMRKIIQFIKTKNNSFLFTTSILDWIVDVHFKFKLDTETLFLTISIIDRVLEIHQISKSKFQLYGVTALFIASKYEEVYTVPHVRDLVYVCDNAYTKEEILATEGKIISLLGFDFLTTSPLRMLNVYQETAKLDQKNYMLARYLIELSVLEYSMIQFSNNVLASASIYLVHKIRRIHPSWNQDQMVPLTGLNELDIRICAKEMCSLLQNQDKKQFASIKKKFSMPKYCEVSKIRIEKKPSQNLQTLPQ